jgi:hypothetical protein
VGCSRKELVGWGGGEHRSQLLWQPARTADECVVIERADVGPERRVIHGDRPDSEFGFGLLAAHLKRDLKLHGAYMV